MNPYFNLAEEKWIRVLETDGSVKEATILDALSRASEYRGLAGETSTQDVAMLRFLMAVLYVSLFNQDYEMPDDALNAWYELWAARRFPVEPIAAYLTQWRERFWLFHDERPFCQVSAGRDGITMENAAGMSGLEKPGKPAAKGVQKASKLNGAIFESGNTDKLFNIATGTGKNSLSCPEAARWLIHVIGFDDGGIKPYYEKNSSMNCADDLAKCSVAWLGSISPVYAEGDTLFETLMLNMVLLKNGEYSEEALWPRQRPSWEYDTPHTIEMTGVPLPDNPAELCSFLSRRIMLIRKGERVLGFVRYVGEAFAREAASTEQWTLWMIPKAKKGETGLPVPRSSRLPAQIWREMGSLVAVRDGDYPPGVVRWVRLLGQPDHSPLRDALCRFRYVKALYDVAQSSSMTEILEDSLTFSVGLLSDAGRAWLELLGGELELLNRVAWQLGLLAEQLLSAEGGKVFEGKNKRTATAEACRNAAQERFFHELDQPFRLWLQGLRAEDDSLKRQERVQQLRRIGRRIALNCGREMLDQVSPSAYCKRGKGEAESHSTAPEAWLLFRRAINKLIRVDAEQSSEGGADI